MFLALPAPRAEKPAEPTPSEQPNAGLPSDSVEWGPPPPAAGEAPRLGDGPGAGGGYDEEVRPDEDGPGAGGGYDEEAGPEDGPGAGGGYAQGLPSAFEPLKPMLCWRGPTLALMAFEPGPGVGGGYLPAGSPVDGVEDRVKEGER